MRNWKKKFENKFIADDILDCIPLANWEEMGDEVFAFIEEEKRKSFEEGRIKQLEEDIEQVKEFLPYQERVEDTEEYWIPTSILLELEDDLKVLRKAKVLEENLRKGGK